MSIEHASSLTLITGGARSGKSTLALNLAEELISSGFDNPLFIATLRPEDPEMDYRVERHKKQRSQSWQTIEESIQLPELLETTVGNPIIIDCIAVWVTNLIFSLIDLDIESIEILDQQSMDRCETLVASQTERLINASRKSKAHVFYVTNEVGFGIVPSTPIGRLFRDVLGHANQTIARSADRTFLTIAGKTLEL